MAAEGKLQPLPPNDKKAAREVITAYTLRAEKNERLWHYTQLRPFRGFGVPPDQPHANDCSGYDSLVFNWAMHWIKRYIADPLGFTYDGWGNTSSLFTFLRDYDAPKDKYLVGDITIYALGTIHAHTTVCRKAGSARTAIFSSNGEESGPEPESLHYRDDLTGVFRHPQLR
jgi:hypothetical protein